MFEVGLVDDVAEDLFEEEFDAWEEEYEDKRLRECREDMSLDVSLDGDGSDDEIGFEALSLKAELEAFNTELHGEGKEKKLVEKNVLHVKELKDMGREVLNSGPDCNGAAKLEQLEILQELHVAYEQGKISKCLLLMYLTPTKHHQTKMINELKRYRDGEIEKPPEIPKQMAKLPAIFKILADRGFDGDALSYPHVNIIVTP